MINVISQSEILLLFNRWLINQIQNLYEFNRWNVVMTHHGKRRRTMTFTDTHINVLFRILNNSEHKILLLKSSFRPPAQPRRYRIELMFLPRIFVIEITIRRNRIICHYYSNTRGPVYKHWVKRHRQHKLGTRNLAKIDFIKYSKICYTSNDFDIFLTRVFSLAERNKNVILYT